MGSLCPSTTHGDNVTASSFQEIEPDHVRSFFNGAEGRLEQYFSDAGGGKTGRFFDRLGGGGDRPEIAYQFSADDLLAVTMLGVEIRRETAIEILIDRASEFTALLAEIPIGLDLWEADELHVANDSPADLLWRKLNEVDDIGWVKAGKLLARKRPRLIPVYDRLVKEGLHRDDDQWWAPLRNVLVESADIVDQLRQLRFSSRIGTGISLLRVLDVAIWTLMNDREQQLSAQSLKGVVDWTGDLDESRAGREPSPRESG